MTDPEVIHQALLQAIASGRLRCWCASTRKPCPYHEGQEDMADLAMHYLQHG